AQTTKRQAKDLSDEAKRRLVLDKVANGRFSQAARLLISYGVMPPSQQTRDALADLHPDGPELDFDMDELPHGLHITRQMAESSLIMLQNGSPPGPARQSADHLK